MKTYRVQLMKDSTYEVIEKTFVSSYESLAGEIIEPSFNEKSIFQGDIVECEAYIRLKEKGQILNNWYNPLKDNEPKQH